MIILNLGTKGLFISDAINQLTEPISHYALPDVNKPYLTEAKGQVCTCTMQTHAHMDIVVYGFFLCKNTFSQRCYVQLHGHRYIIHHFPFVRVAKTTVCAKLLNSVIVHLPFSRE